MTGASRHEGAIAAGRQVHRQRMGAVMGPTIVRQRFKLDAGGSAPVELVRELMRALSPLAKKVPPFKLDPSEAMANIDAYKIWLDEFIRILGYQDSTAYIGLHILRKHILAQTILASTEQAPSNAQEAEKCLQAFHSAKWFTQAQTMKRLAELVPDQAEYLHQLGGVMRPWQLSEPHLHSV